jgi:16S rRNA processing protein RimM
MREEPFDRPENVGASEGFRGEMLLEVGRVSRPHGLKGDVIVGLITNRPEERLAPGSRLVTDDGVLEVVSSSPHQNRWIVTFAGVNSREAADRLRGTVLRAEPLDEEGTLWVHELVGSLVVTTDGQSVGTVESVQPSPASDLLVLEDERLVPMTFVVATSPGQVVIDPPEGLLDL